MISCGPMRFAYKPVIFEMPSPELQGYRSLTFWRNPNTYVESVPSLSTNVLGTWILSADTLTCIPKCLYYENNGEFTCEKIDSSNINVMSIPQVYIVLKNTLNGITDYSVILDFEGSNIEDSFSTKEITRPKMFLRK